MKTIFIALISLMIFLPGMAQHTVILKSGEKMNGKVQSMKDGVIHFNFKGNAMTLQLADVSSIVFIESAESGASTNKSQGRNEPGEKQITAGSYLIRYKVADRIIKKAPLVSNLTQEKGTVVVEISIDKYGHVLKAAPGAPGTTTTSEYLLTKAMQAAKSAEFDKIPTAPLEQSGYMIIPF